MNPKTKETKMPKSKKKKEIDSWRRRRSFIMATTAMAWAAIFACMFFSVDSAVGSQVVIGAFAQIGFVLAVYIGSAAYEDVNKPKE